MAYVVETVWPAFKINIFNIHILAMLQVYMYVCILSQALVCRLLTLYIIPSHRHSKPFNPLLGETYEMVNKEGGYCVVTEQVSHHPPVTAMYAESEKWVLWQEYTLHIKFRGQVRLGLLEHFNITVRSTHSTSSSGDR